MEIKMILNLSHYAFFPIADLAQARKFFEERFHGHQVLGTLLMAPEGVNFNLASSEGEFLVEQCKKWLEDLGAPEAEFKLSYSEKMTFRRLRIKLKKEIITMGVENLEVEKLRAPHMAPQEFKRLLEEQPEHTLILDTRNDFEVEYGTFKGAQAAGMSSFRDFPNLAKSLPKDKAIVMFCTGGVRCEKASAYLRKEGFPKVYQLEGGILRYLEKEGFSHFDGECFVFDQRISIGSSEGLGENGSIGRKPS